MCAASCDRRRPRPAGAAADLNAARQRREIPLRHRGGRAQLDAADRQRARRGAVRLARSGGAFIAGARAALISRRPSARRGGRDRAGGRPLRLVILATLTASLRSPSTRLAMVAAGIRRGRGAAWPLDFGRNAVSRPISGQEGADAIDEGDAGRVGQLAQHRRADAAHAEREAEEQARDHADPPGQQLLRIDQDGREGRGQDQADRSRVSTPSRTGRRTAAPG